TVSEAASAASGRAQPTTRPNALNPISTTAPETRLQQLEMANPIASAKKSTRSVVMSPTRFPDSISPTKCRAAPRYPYSRVNENYHYINDLCWLTYLSGPTGFFGLIFALANRPPTRE